MKYSNSIEYNISTKLDSKGLTQLKTELQSLELKLQNMGNKGLLDEKTFVDARTQIQGLGNALTEAFNPSLGMLNLAKFNQELKDNGVTAQGLKSAFGQMGAEGQVAFNNLVKEVGKLDAGILRTSSSIDKIFVTFSNTFRWGLISSFFSQFMNAIHSSVQYAKDLDDSLTQIMLVTDYSRDSMNEYARAANEAAKAVGQTTVGMTNASLIFAQQGYDLDQSQQLATLSAKLANASQQDTAATSDQITAYMNAYGLQDSMDELVQAMDNWAKIANISAADVEEIALASQRAASMANAVGVSGEALAAQIATIESVTREAPEQIGNGLKTLYARFSDLKLGKDDEDGIGLGKVTSTLQQIGVQVLDAFGNVRDMDDIMEDLMVVWEDLDDTSKTAAAQALAGKHQVNRFMALMENADMYQEYKGATGASASGTLEEMNTEYLDSWQGRVTKLQASLEGLFSTVFDTDAIYPWIDAAQGAVDLLQKFFDALGGGQTVLFGLGSLLMQVFSKNIAQQINNASTNLKVQNQKRENLQNAGAALTNLGVVNPNPQDQNSQNIINFARYMNENAQNWNTEQINQANAIMQELVQNSNAATLAAGELKKELEQVGTGVVAALGENGFEDFVDQFGAINQSLLTEYLKNNPEEKLADLFSNMVEKIQPAREAVLNFNKALQDHQKNLDQYGFESEEAAESASRLRDALTDLKDRVNGDTIDRYANALSEIENNADNASEETAKLTGETARLVEELDELDKKDISNIREGLSNTSFRSLNSQSAATDSDKTRRAFQEGMDSQAQVQNILNTLNAVQQLTFAWQAFQNLGSLWANDEPVDGERILQTIMSLTMALPQLINGLQSLHDTQIFQGMFNTLQAIPNMSSMIKQFDQLAQAQEKGVAAWEAIERFTGEHPFEELPKGLEEIARAGDKATDTMRSMDSEVDELSGIAKIFGQGVADAAKQGATGLGLFAGGLKAVGAAAMEALTPLLPFIAIGAAIGAVAFAIGKQLEEIERAKEAAIDALHEAQDVLNQAKAVSDQVGSFRTTYNNNTDGSKNNELINQANDIASAMKEAGYESEAMAIHLAVVRAEAAGTAEAFAELATTVDESRRQMEIQADVDAANASAEVLRTQNASLEQIISNESKLKDAQEQLNNLSPWDPAYETKKAELEEYIASLKEAATWTEEAADAAHTYMGAAGDVVGSSSWVLGDSATLGQIEAFFTQQIPEFALLTEAQKLDYMLQYITDDAQRATVSVEQLLDANSSLSDNTDFQGYSSKDYIYQAFNDMGLNSEQQVKVLATLDMDASEQEIRSRLAEINQKMSEEGMTFDMALKSTMEPEDARAMTQQEFSSMQATDADVNQEEFQELGNYLAQTAEAAEDLPDYLAYDAEALADFTEAILRYDDAVETAINNMDDWEDTLNNARGNSQKMAKATSELAETYADLLDLDPNSVLSADFSGSIRNLEDLQLAIEGDEDAYRRLQEAAMLDISPDIDLSGVENLDDILTNMGSNFDNASFSATNFKDLMLEAGAALDGIDWEANPVLNDDPFIDGLNQLIASGVMTSEQVQAALAAMGYDVELEPVQSEVESPEVAYNWVSDITPNEWHGTLPVTPDGMSDMSLSTTGSTRPIEGSVPNITYSAKPVESTAVNQAAATAMKVNTEGGQSGGGGTQIKSITKKATGGQKSGNASHGGGNRGGGKGGGCFIAGTLVSLQNQFKNIEDIQIGDIVLSYNEEIHQNEYSIVLQTMIHDVTEEIYDLYIEDEILTVTGIHRFYVRRKHDIEWIPASDLHIGDYVLFADGNWHPIFKIKVKIRSLLVYNFEVSHNHNYYVGRNQILAHNKGGGGGGGSAKTIQPKEKKEHKKDYYEKVNSQLDKLKEQLSGIEKQEDRLIGSKARANQQKQIKLIEREIELEKERLKILQDTADSELKDVKAAMEAKDKLAEDILKGRGINFNIPAPEYDENGIITNYEAISAKIDEAHNKLIDQYNAAAAAGNEDLTKTIDEAIKKYDEYSAAILENAKRQNDIQKEIESTKNTIQELSDSIEDINIEIYKVSLEAIENLKDLNEVHAEFAGFLSGFKTDSPLRALIEDLDELNNSYAVSANRVQEFYNTLIAEKEKAKKSADDDEKAVIDKEIEYFQKKINEAAAGTETELWANGEVGYYLEALRELRKWMNGEEDEESPNIFGNNAKALYETYLDVYKKTKESALDYEKMVEDTVEDIIDIYDEVADKQEEYLKGYEHWVEKFEKFKDMYTLAYGEESYAAISALEKKQGEILQAQTQRQQEIYNYWAAQYAEAIKEGSGVSQEVKDAIKEHMQEAEEALWDLGQKAGETFVQAYEDAVKGAVQKLNSQVLPEGDSDFNRIDREWEWAKEFVDNYKDEVEKTFEVEKLRNKYADLLNEAQGSSLATQNKIRKQMEEQLKLLEDEEHMSQFDIDLANSKLLILQKQIALEDAQRNKNQMQLRRDSQGNYRYVYRASQNDIAKARQEYLEAIEEGYELSKRHATDTAEKLEATLKKFGEDWENLNTDMNISDEKRQEQSIKLMNDFIEYMDYLAEDFGEGQDGLTNILNEMVMNSTESTAKAAQLMLSNLFDNTSNLLDAEDRAWWDYADALSEIFSKINKDNRTLVEELANTTNGEMDDLRNNLTGDNGVLSVIGKEINSEDGYNSAVQDATVAIKDLNIQTQNLLTEGLQPFNDAIANNINDIINWESTLADARTTLKELQEDYERLSKIMGEDAAAKNTINIPETPPSTNTQDSTTAINAETAKQANRNRLLNYTFSGSGGNRKYYANGKQVTGKEAEIIQDFINYGIWGKNYTAGSWSTIGSKSAEQIFKEYGYDTGGYTGEWGKNGKLAVLHQKELVLNAEDTRNILSAVDIVRQMTSTLGNALTNYSIGGARNSLMNSGFGTVDQRVEIKAEFPNVRDAFEIETALTNLADTAYQYAHRKI